MHDVYDTIKLVYIVYKLVYSSTVVALLPSGLSVLSEHVASQRKWQSADLDLLILAKKRKSVCPALFGVKVCI